ncbi:universal stress protein [Halorhabdus sp. CUG00001]|uniref:universal stress protein n=1 Tax=Halorhabdus sp. CUG00001 TaxID=2600297 RepID=UPI00131AF350|nr:universal stress protein [Halorhabdus sp. CUG00001]
MVDRILFPTDGSAGAMAVLEHALDLATDHEASVHLLTVDESGFDSAELLALAGDRARERGLDPETVRREGEVYQEILAYAQEAAVDAIVMPTHGRSGLERLLLGSVTARIMRLADIPVLTATPDAELRYPYRRILVPTDGSQAAQAAVEVGATLARVAAVPLAVLSVVEQTQLGATVRSTTSREHMEDRSRTAVKEATETARSAGVSDISTAVVTGRSIPETIRSYVSDQHSDLVVLGTHGRTGLDRYLFGSTTEALVRTATVPVMTVRPPDKWSG